MFCSRCMCVIFIWLYSLVCSLCGNLLSTTLHFANFGCCCWYYCALQFGTRADWEEIFRWGYLNLLVWRLFGGGWWRFNGTHTASSLANFAAAAAAAALERKCNLLPFRKSSSFSRSHLLLCSVFSWRGNWNKSCFSARRWQTLSLSLGL